MKKEKTFLTVIALFLYFFSWGQKQAPLHFGQRFIVGTSLTFIPNTENNYESVYKEFTWNKNIAINLNKSLYFGLSHLNLYTSGSSSSSSFYPSREKENYSLFGAFLQYDFLPTTKNRLFAETSWHRGNYCTCKNEDPYKKEGLDYLGFGIGYDISIAKLWSVDLAFSSHQILQKLQGGYNYTQYVIGINFDFIKSK